MADDAAVKVGGAYKESDDFVPNPADMSGQFNTSGLGASGRIEEVAAVFEVDKVKTAEQILGALDPDNTAVGSDRVILPNLVDDNDVARDEIRAAAEARVEQGVVIGEPGPAERAAAEEGDEFEGLRAEATATDAPQNAAAQKSVNATGTPASATGDSTGTDEDAEDDEDKAPAKSASKGEWVDYAVSKGADKDEADAATKDDLIEKYGN